MVGVCIEVVSSLVFIFLLFPMKVAKGNPWLAWVTLQEETNFTTFHNKMQGLENYHNG